MGKTLEQLKQEQTSLLEKLKKEQAEIEAKIHEAEVKAKLEAMAESRTKFNAMVDEKKGEVGTYSLTVKADGTCEVAFTPPAVVKVKRSRATSEGGDGRANVNVAEVCAAYGIKLDDPAYNEWSENARKGPVARLHRALYLKGKTRKEIDEITHSGNGSISFSLIGCK